MGFFDMGIAEILLVIVVALIIWGPGKIPEIARTLGKAVGILRKTSLDLTEQIKKELEIEEDETRSHSSNNTVQKINPPAIDTTEAEVSEQSVPESGETQRQENE